MVSSHLVLDGVRVELTHWAAVPVQEVQENGKETDEVEEDKEEEAPAPLLVVFMEVERGVPEGRVHVDVLFHRFQHRVGRWVPV